MTPPRVGYLTFGRDDFGFGLSLCLSELPKDSVYRVTPKTAKLVQWLVFSCFWWEHLYVLAAFLREAGISKRSEKRPQVVVGGFNTVNPVPFLPYADAVSVGDGEGVLTALTQHAEPIPANVLTETQRHISYGYASTLRPWCHETNQIARIEVARGCRFACAFCAVTFLKSYRELPIEGVKTALRMTKLRRVALFAPEPTCHSQDEQITALAHAMGKVRCDSDVRIDRLDRRKDSVPRVGIEGVSERLRRQVHKPLSNEKILESVARAIRDGRRGMFWYLILDLPGEAPEDFEEFRELLRRVGEIPGAKNFVLKPSPSVLLPTPFTPLQHAGIHWDRDYRTLWHNLFRSADGERDWEVCMAERDRVFSPGMRLLSMLSTRGGEEFFEIEREASASKAIGISGGRPVVKNLTRLVRILNRYGGPDRWCGQIVRGIWENVVQPPLRQSGKQAMMDKCAA